MHLSESELLFFDASPDALPLYLRLRERILAEIPETAVEVKKTQISLRNGFLFAAVSFTPVRRAAQRPPVFLTLTLGLPAQLCSPRVDVAVEVSPRRWTHHILLSREEEIDEELLGWLREAAAFAGRKRRVRPT